MRNRVAEVRTEIGWTQAELSAKSGVSRQTISDIESGAHAAGLETALRLANAMGKLVEELFILKF
jgi:putative transcriptional regulator